jgi:hypothetical protein
MAGAAILSEFPGMLIILLVAGKTVFGCALKDTVDMAIRTFHFGV